MADHQDFFSQLLPGQLSPAEIELRHVLHRAATLVAGLLPKNVTLQDWVEHRIPGELFFGRDGTQRVTLLPATVPKGPRSELHAEFFAKLPVDSYTEAEEELRDSIFDFLVSWQSQDLASLTQLGADKAFKQAKSAALPGGIPIREWIERRMGAELELRKDAKGQFVVHLTPEAQPRVRDRFEAKKLEEKAAAEGPPSEEVRQRFFQSLPSTELTARELTLRDRLLDFCTSWESSRPGGSLPLLSDACSDPAVRAAKAGLLPKGLPFKEWIDHRIGMEIETREQPNGHCAIFFRGSAPERTSSSSRPSTDDIEEFKRVQEEKREAFFATLPVNDFSEEELELRQALLTFIAQWPAKQGSPDLGKAGQDSIVQTCRAALLPKGCGCSLQHWIDRRIGGEIETARFGATTVCDLRGKLQVDKSVQRQSPLATMSKRAPPLDHPAMRRVRARKRGRE